MMLSSRKVVEQAVVFQLKPDLTDELKEKMVQGFADFKTTCPQWVVAESAGNYGLYRCYR